jgi:sigma-B regulation protein RsbU (phosphoserine phosphatase)
MQPKNETVLVIDDEDFVRDTITGYLEDSGIEVIEAENGRQGVELFDQHHPALVLCDLRMPKMDGLEVLNHVMEQRPDTPFIVLSGAGVMKDVVEALRLGASDYLFKPLADLAMLEHSIRRNLERSRLRQDVETYRAELEATYSQLQSDLRAGRKIQQKMLPEKPLLRQGWVFDYIIAPSHIMSGDFVDFFPLSEHETFYYLVDVSGHGVSSAIITMVIKQFVEIARRDFAHLNDPSIFTLDKFLSRLNQQLIAQDLGRHATVFAGVLNTEADTMTYCSAAQFPPPIVSVADGCEVIPSDGMAVGLFPDAQYHMFERTLSGVEGFFFCTDGILEIIQESSLSAKENLIKQTVEAGNRSISSFSEAIGLNGVEGLPDDITIFTINRTR